MPAIVAEMQAQGYYAHLHLARTLVVFVCCLACVESKGLILLVMLGKRSGSAACRW